MENKKQIKDVRCKGRMPETRKSCNAVLYQSDGEYLYIIGLVLNPSLKVQRIVCDKCGYAMVWKRNEKFRRR